MNGQLKLMCVLAHPDDESLGLGGVLARYASEGIDIYLVTATRGEKGWPAEDEPYPGSRKLGAMREEELYKAADVLGIREVTFLDYQDGELDEAEPERIIAEIANHLRRVRPHVVITFDPYGAYGHPDHIAICQFTTAAIVRAAEASQRQNNGAMPHQVSKLYYRVDTETQLAIYEGAFGELVMEIDGEERRGIGWPTWAITTWIDTQAYWQQAWEAVRCHQTQVPQLEALQALPMIWQEELWKREGFYRAFSLVNGGREKETDLFAGLRETELETTIP